MKKLLVILTALFMAINIVFAGTDSNGSNSMNTSGYQELDESKNGSYYQWLGYQVNSSPGSTTFKLRIYANTTDSKFYWAEYYTIKVFNSNGDQIYVSSTNGETSGKDVIFTDSSCNIGGNYCSGKTGNGKYYKYFGTSMDITITGAGSYTIKISDKVIGNQQVSTTGNYTINNVEVKPATVTLSYNGNGATSGSVGTSTVNQNTNATVANNGFAKTGYLFKN